MLLEKGIHVYKTKKTHCREMGEKIKCYLNADKKQMKAKPCQLKVMPVQKLLSPLQHFP